MTGIFPHIIINHGNTEVEDGEGMTYIDFVADVRKKYFMLAAFQEEAVFSDETAQFRTPAEPSSRDFTEVRIRVGHQQVKAVYLCIHNQKLFMEKKEQQESFDIYRVVLPPSKEQQVYFFELECEKERYYYTKYGISKEMPHDGYFCILRDFFTPKWARGAVLYQIYVDRFYNGDKANDVQTGEYRYLGKLCQKAESWDVSLCEDDFRCFYGGDLKGICLKLDYLRKLGVEGIYLNPIFVSPSSHKYDTQDYDHIDPHYGKIAVDYPKVLQKDELNEEADMYRTRTTNIENLEASDALFAELVQEAHERGIHVILDGVFNHCGAFHKWLDREEIYGGTGAYGHPKSPYRPYFCWNEDGSYEGWWGYENHPKLFYENSHELYEKVLNIGKKWVSPPYCADGWRLDVAADLGKSPTLNHQFWQDFHDAVKSANPNAIILAEHYGDATPWLQGDQWDSVMNYDGFMEPVTWFFTGVSKHSDAIREDLYCNADAFWNTMAYHRNYMPIQAQQLAMNELSNHDHSRFLTRTNGKIGRLHTEGSEAADTGINEAVFREAVLMQMTWIGSPTIYYGDEAGLTGWTDPDNRRPFPWGKENQELISYHEALIKLRKEHPALRHGSLQKLAGEYGILAYGRFDKEEKLVVVYHNLDEEKEITLPVWQMGIKEEGSMEVLLETNQKGYFCYGKDGVSSWLLPVKDGCVTINLLPRGGILMKEV